MSNILDSAIQSVQQSKLLGAGLLLEMIQVQQEVIKLVFIYLSVHQVYFLMNRGKKEKIRRKLYK